MLPENHRPQRLRAENATECDFQISVVHIRVQNMHSRNTQCSITNYLHFYVVAYQDL